MKASIGALLTATILHTGCMTSKTIHNTLVARDSNISLTERLSRSSQVQEQRKHEATSFTLAEKQIIFERLWEYHRMPEPFSGSKKRRLEIEAMKYDRIEPHFMVQDLLASANKAYITKESAHIKDTIRTLEDLLLFEKAFGEPGQMPDRIFIAKEKPEREHTMYELLEPSIPGTNVFLQDDAHGNTMHYHFQGLFETYKMLIEPQIGSETERAQLTHLLAEHTDRALTYLFKNDFVMRNPDGTNTTYGDLSGKEYFGFAKNATLAKLMILESGLDILTATRPQSQNIFRAQTEISKELEKGSLKKIENMNSTFANISFSSYASDRRVFHNLCILATIGASRDHGAAYEKAFQAFYTDKRYEQNIFYTFSLLRQKPEWSYRDVQDAWQAQTRLQSFPLMRENVEVLNSFNSKVPHNGFSLVRKHGLIPMSKKPLPYWQQGTSGNAWKERPLSLNYNVHETRRCFQNPQDILLVMYMAKQLGFFPEEEKRIDHTKIDTYLEAILPRYEAAYENTHTPTH